jgi:ferredoxin--NADP+ reductase
MSNFNVETVTGVRHWNDSLFSFTTTRDSGFRYRNGHFTMVGLEVENRPLVRAYSIASANYEENLEFFSIKVQDGPLTSRLQHLQAKATRSWSAASPPAPWCWTTCCRGKQPVSVRHRHRAGAVPQSIIRDPETYERFERVVLTHGVRTVSANWPTATTSRGKNCRRTSFSATRCAKSCCTTPR